MGNKSKSAQTRVLEIIYIFFIGILTAIFVGVGIAAFYPEPERPEMPAELSVLRSSEAPIDSSTESAELVSIQKEYDAQLEEHREVSEVYNRNVSIIALIAAVLVLAISLTTFQSLKVIADGLLLGGVISLLYSVFRIFSSGDDKIRFLVVTVCLAIALALGYFKFIREEE